MAAGAAAQGGSLSNSGTSNSGAESAGGSSPSGGTNEQAGSSSASGGDEPGAGSGSGGTAGQDSGGGSAGVPGTGGTSGTGGTAGSGGSGGSGGSKSSGPCPDVFGDYAITDVEGSCFGLNPDATQSITGNVPQCLAHFVSVPQDGGRGINGAGALDATGAFKGAVLSFNDTQRMNCTGTWDAVNERMTVKCGAPGELCTVVLERK